MCVLLNHFNKSQRIVFIKSKKFAFKHVYISQLVHSFKNSMAKTALCVWLYRNTTEKTFKTLSSGQ